MLGDRHAACAAPSARGSRGQTNTVFLFGGAGCWPPVDPSFGSPAALVAVSQTTTRLVLLPPVERIPWFGLLGFIVWHCSAFGLAGRSGFWMYAAAACCAPVRRRWRAEWFLLDKEGKKTRPAPPLRCSLLICFSFPWALARFAFARRQHCCSLLFYGWSPFCCARLSSKRQLGKIKPTCPAQQTGETGENSADRDRQRQKQGRQERERTHF